MVDKIKYFFAAGYCYWLNLGHEAISRRTSVY